MTYGTLHSYEAPHPIHTVAMTRPATAAKFEEARA